MSKAKRKEKNPNVHHVMHWILQNSKLNRREIAEKLGIARQSLYDREYQITAVREHMIDELLEAAAVSAEKIPLHIKQRDIDAELVRFNKMERQKERAKAASQTAQPTQAPIDPLEAVDAKGETLEDHIARRKPTNNPLTLARRAKEDAIIAARNPKPTPKVNPNLTPHGGHAKLPTTAKRGARVGEIQSLGDIRNIPFPDDYVQPAGDSRIPKQYINLVNFPDLVYEAKQTMKPYEVRYIPRHKVPYPGEAGILLRPEAWYTISTTGKMRSASTQAEAQTLAEQLRAEDDKAIAEFM